MDFDVATLLPALTNKSIFGIHGGGNIGLGLMADVIGKSLTPYHVIATSNDKFLAALVNAQQHFWLQHVGSTSESYIKNINIVNRDFKNIVDLYKASDLIAICLTPGAFSSSAKSIAAGLIERYQENKPLLKVFVLMNVPNCAETVRKRITKEIYSLLDDAHAAQSVLQSVEFVATVVDRIVTKIPSKVVREELAAQLFACFNHDPENAKLLKKHIEATVAEPRALAAAIQTFDLKFKLFNVEENFALYVSSKVKEAWEFPHMTKVNNVSQVDIVKNKFINGPHAILAWFGALVGCKTIASAIHYPGMWKYIETIMEQEIAPALTTAYPDISKQELKESKNLFLKRCAASKEDPVSRVARDPLRKIDSGGRIRGTIELTKTKRLQKPVGLEQGIAAAILYSVTKLDPSNAECNKICDLYNKNKSYRDVLVYQGSSPSGIFRGLDPHKEADVIEDILEQITFLKAKGFANQKQQSLPSMELLMLPSVKKEVSPSWNIFRFFSNLFSGSKASATPATEFVRLPS